MTWTVEELLDYVQELIGENPGDFYNITTRLNLLNQAQTIMLTDSRYYKLEENIDIVAGTQSYALGSGFMQFGGWKMDFTEDGASEGDRHVVELVSERVVEDRYPNWRETGTSYRGTPEFAVAEEENIILVPTPDTNGTLIVPYLGIPTEMTDLSDTAMLGVERLQRFAPGLAYFVANQIMLPRQPQTALLYKGMFDDMMRDMRAELRDSTTKESYLPSYPISSWS